MAVRCWISTAKRSCHVKTSNSILQSLPTSCLAGRLACALWHCLHLITVFATQIVVMTAIATPGQLAVCDAAAASSLAFVLHAARMRCESATSTYIVPKHDIHRMQTYHQMSTITNTSACSGVSRTAMALYVMAFTSVPEAWCFRSNTSPLLHTTILA